MIKDITPMGNTWLDLYAETGFTVGTSLLLQNKSNWPAYVWEGAAPPVVTAGETEQQGYELARDLGPAKTSAGAAGLWIYCWQPEDAQPNGWLCVQEYAP
ncbi:hypothetical protein NNO07_17460 [Pseudomonas resinovorans]|uniref:Uncharacterized protein n=1 Tax=Metapseudomonas resinovorans TaxID=53412 RepID=A0ABT4Y7Q9_METRE|nr:hypothetical protein [Pseudomonas resinovorans]MDA8484859.1 hypothetical protein [Pseudomonas resinovorans]